MSMLIIANPAAGANRGAKIIPLLEEILKKMGVGYSIAISRYKGEEVNLAKEGMEKGFKLIVALGGDGTINQVVNGIMWSIRVAEASGHPPLQSLLGIIPAGTGSDLVKTLNIPVKIEDAVSVLLNGRERLIDIGEIRCAAWQEARYFINISGIGIDAVTVRELEYAKRVVSGSLAYFYALLRALWKYHGLTLRIKIEEKDIRSFAYLVAVANGRFFGGGFKIAPDAEPSDGLFEICIIEKVNILRTFLNLYSVIKGRHANLPEVKMFKGKEIAISSDYLMPLEIDGEIGGEAKEYHISIHHKALKIIIPN